MQLKKKISDELMAAASYTESNGIALRVTGKDDRYLNSVALIECVDGELRLTLFDDAIDHYGIKIAHEKTNPETW